MAGNLEVIAGYDRRLRRRNPEIHDPLQREIQERPRMLADELPRLLAFLRHETDFAQLLKLLHGPGIVCGMFLARPESRGLVVVRHVNLHGQVVAHKDELAENPVITHQPGTNDQRRGQYTQRDSTKLTTGLWSPSPQPEQATQHQGKQRWVGENHEAPQQTKRDPPARRRRSVRQAKGEQQSQAQQESAQAGVVNYADRPINQVGKHRPGPGSAAGNRDTVDSLTDTVNRRTG